MTTSDDIKFMPSSKLFLWLWPNFKVAKASGRYNYKFFSGQVQILHDRCAVEKMYKMLSMTGARIYGR